MYITDNNEKVEYCLMGIDLEEGEKDILINYARMAIFNDTEELINYAINRLLKESIESGEIKEILEKAEKNESE